MPALAPALVVACINATMADDVAITKLREAAGALDGGDVETARSLAREVSDAELGVEATGSDGDVLRVRAARLLALSFVRDRGAQHEELVRAASALAAEHEHAQEHGAATPQLAADYGEALERAREDARAYQILAPLADRDLIGSAYANAALARVAERRGDLARAELGRARCLAAAARPSVCRGEYPPRPLFRGRAADYAIPGLVLLGAALARARRRRPWSVHAAHRLSGAISVGGWALILLANARLGWAAGLVALALVVGVAVAQRRLFLRAAALGEVPGFHLRAPEPGDENAPLLHVFLGPRTACTLELAGDAAYREVARRPVLRLARRRVNRPIALGLAVSALIVAALAVGTLTLSRGG